MNTKITLYTDRELIEEIKAYAKAHNTSVSKIVNAFFKNLLQQQEPDKKPSKITDSLTGILRGKKIDESDYREYLADKYL